MSTKDRVYRIVKRIPKGRVLTYGLLAKLAGIKSPRIVGNILHRNIDPDKISCHRLVNFRGMLADHYAFGGKRAQAEKLQKEGVVVCDGKVDLLLFLWNP